MHAILFFVHAKTSSTIKELLRLKIDLVSYPARAEGLVNRIYNKRMQRPGKTVENFIQDLFKLAEECEYYLLKDEMIRNRMVVGVLIDTVLNAKAYLTLEQGRSIVNI